MKQALSDQALNLVLSREAMTMIDGITGRNSATCRQSNFTYLKEVGIDLNNEIEQYN